LGSILSEPNLLNNNSVLKINPSPPLFGFVVVIVVIVVVVVVVVVVVCEQPSGQQQGD